MSELGIVLVFGAIAGGSLLYRWPRIDAQARHELVITRDRLDIPAEGVYPQAVHRRFAARRRGQLLGLAVAFAVVFAPMAWQLGHGDDFSAWVIMLAPVCSALGSMIAVLATPPPRPSGRVLVMTARRSTGGYLPPVERLVALLAPVFTLAAMALSVWAVVAGDLGRSGGVIALASGVAALGMWAWAARLEGSLLVQPTPGADRVDLAWHEALRALSLRDATTVQALTCLVAAIVPYAVGSDWASGRLVDRCAVGLACVSALGISALLLAQVLDVCLGWFRRHAGAEVLR